MGSNDRKPTPEQEGAALAARLGGRWEPGGALCRCPAHDDRSPSLSIRAGRTRLLLHCFAGCSAGDVLRALQAEGLLQAAQGARAAAPQGLRENRLEPAARRLWSESRGLEGTPAQRYLSSRGLECASSQLRFHPRTPHGRRPLTRYRPALIAAVRDETGLKSIHRTFLDCASSGPLGRFKSGLGRYCSGAVRLGGIGPRLGLAEGIETALSASLLFNVPCWATLGTERFGRVSLPPETEELLLFLDNDCGGRRAERLARDAHSWVPRIETHVPTDPGADWNDVLRPISGSLIS